MTTRGYDSKNHNYQCDKTMLIHEQQTLILLYRIYRQSHLQYKNNDFSFTVFPGLAQNKQRG